MRERVTRGLEVCRWRLRDGSGMCRVREGRGTRGSEEMRGNKSWHCVCCSIGSQESSEFLFQLMYLLGKAPLSLSFYFYLPTYLPTYISITLLKYTTISSSKTLRHY